MSWFMLAIQILAQLPELLAIAEKAFDDEPDSGAQKKEMVLATVKAIVGGVVGDSKIWNKVKMIIDPAINIMCIFLFPNEK
jgi:hypothetical protein